MLSEQRRTCLGQGHFHFPSEERLPSNCVEQLACLSSITINATHPHRRALRTVDKCMQSFFRRTERVHDKVGARRPPLLEQVCACRFVSEREGYEEMKE